MPRPRGGALLLPPEHLSAARNGFCSERLPATGPDMVILGSGSIVSQLTQARLIDAYQFVVVPVVLGQGRTMFDGVRDRLQLTRTSERAFKNGNVLVAYESPRLSTSEPSGGSA